MNLHRLKIEFISLFGKRTIKTAVSVFITALICELLNWPVIFAVIAAIVTIEPTVNASVKKGMIRLPAAAIGAAFAMFFNAWLGQVPLSYALSAFFTIYVCHRLKWNDAVIVATLTAVNMITLTYEDFLTNFFIRIGTTSTGIIVSTLVNFFIFPPNFIKEIRNQYVALTSTVLNLLQNALMHQINSKGSKENLNDTLTAASKQVEQLLTLISYQQDEYRYHRFKLHTAKEVKRIQQKVNLIKYVISRTGNIISIENQNLILMSESDRTPLLQAWQTIEKDYQLRFQSKESRNVDNQDQVSTLHILFQLMNREQSSVSHVISPKNSTLIAYELAALHKVITKGKI